MSNIFKGYDLLRKLIKENPEFRDKFLKYRASGEIAYFGQEDWLKITNQNFLPPPYPPYDEIESFYQLFEKGINIGACIYSSKQLSYSFDNVDLVRGFQRYLVGTPSSKNGGHCWMEVDSYIYDTTLLIKIKKEIAVEMGYSDKTISSRTSNIECVRWDYETLMSNGSYRARKKYINDPSIKSKSISNDDFDRQYENITTSQIK